MEQRNRTPFLKVITEGIAYFVSGVFVVNYVIPLLLSEDQGSLLNQAGNWLTVIVGGFSVLVGFLFVSTVIPFRQMPKLLRYFDERKDWMLFILFPITLPQIFQNLGHRAIFVLVVVFLFFILSAMVSKTWFIITRDTRTYVRNLVTLSLAFSMSTIIRLLQGANRTEIVIFLIVICVLLGLVLKGRNGRQLRLFRR